MLNIFIRVWRSPGMILTVVITGSLFGLLYPDNASLLRPLSDLYLALIQMVMLPIMTCAIISSLGSALIDGGGARILIKVFFVFVVLLFVCAVSAFVIGIIMHPGSGLSADAQQSLGLAMQQRDGQITQSIGMWGFVLSLFPTNIVFAASQGQMLGVMTFSILIGIGLGSLDDEAGRPVIASIDIIMQSCLKIMGWILMVLPLGIFALLSVNMAKLGVDAISLALKLIATFYLTVALSFVIIIIVISARCRLPPMKVIKLTWAPVVLGFVTQADYPPMPMAIKASENLGVDSRTSKLVVPLGTNMLNLGYVFYVVIASLFVIQMYLKPVTIDVICIVIIGGILVAVAGADLAMLTIVFGPIGLPFEAAVAVLAPLGPLLNPVLVPINVLGNIAAATFVAKFESDQPHL